MFFLAPVKLFALKILQDRFIFKPKKRNISPAKSPETYGLPWLTEKNITTEDGVKIVLWQAETREPTMPVFIVFQGNTGHFGDVGRPKSHDEYDPRYRLNLLEEIHITGAGIIAVNMRGYGRSEGTPSEEGFKKDIQALIKFITKERNIPHQKIILLGESLGAAVATMMAEEMTMQNIPPAMLIKIAPFASLAHRAKDDHPEFSLETIADVLKHPFDSLRNYRSLSRDMHIYLLHPKDDETTHPKHSIKLHEKAQEIGHNVTYDEIPGGHITWDPNDLVKRIMTAYKGK